MRNANIDWRPCELQVGKTLREVIGASSRHAATLDRMRRFFNTFRRNLANAVQHQRQAHAQALDRAFYDNYGSYRW